MSVRGNRIAWFLSYTLLHSRNHTGSKIWSSPVWCIASMYLKQIYDGMMIGSLCPPELLFFQNINRQPWCPLASSRSAKARMYVHEVYLVETNQWLLNQTNNQFMSPAPDLAIQITSTHLHDRKCIPLATAFSPKSTQLATHVCWRVSNTLLSGIIKITAQPWCLREISNCISKERTAKDHPVRYLCLLVWFHNFSCFSPLLSNALETAFMFARLSPRRNSVLYGLEASTLHFMFPPPFPHTSNRCPSLCSENTSKIGNVCWRGSKTCWHPSAPSKSSTPAMDVSPRSSSNQNSNVLCSKRTSRMEPCLGADLQALRR
jgi:hypothetical protein